VTVGALVYPIVVGVAFAHCQRVACSKLTDSSRAISVFLESLLWLCFVLLPAKPFVRKDENSHGIPTLPHI
jgi:hypothetical protein